MSTHGSPTAAMRQGQWCGDARGTCSCCYEQRVATAIGQPVGERGGNHEQDERSKARYQQQYAVSVRFHDPSVRQTMGLFPEVTAGQLATVRPLLRHFVAPLVSSWEKERHLHHSATKRGSVEVHANSRQDDEAAEETRQQANRAGARQSVAPDDVDGVGGLSRCENGAGVDERARDLRRLRPPLANPAEVDCEGFEHEHRSKPEGR